jgi:hypothetical protein
MWDPQRPTALWASAACYSEPQVYWCHRNVMFRFGLNPFFRHFFPWSMLILYTVSCWLFGCPRYANRSSPQLQQKWQSVTSQNAHHHSYHGTDRRFSLNFAVFIALRPQESCRRSLLSWLFGSLKWSNAVSLFPFKNPVQSHYINSAQAGLPPAPDFRAWINCGSQIVIRWNDMLDTLIPFVLFTISLI